MTAILKRYFGASPTKVIVKLEPGLVLIKAGLSQKEQIDLANLTLKTGEDPSTGFWREVNGQKTLNSRPWRGRMFGSVDSYPSILTEICQNRLAIAAQTDSTIAFRKPTHVISLYYKSLAHPPEGGYYIPPHQDNGENDGEKDSAVVSFSVGDSCDFLITHSKPSLSSGHTSDNPKNLAHRLTLESGDILIFGGPCRYIWHSIQKVYQASAPHFLPFKDARLNWTFRYAPKILGQENRFATIPADQLARSNQFYDLDKMRNDK